MKPFSRILTLIALYATVAAASYWVSWRLRFGFYPGLEGIPGKFADKWLIQGLYIVPVKMLCLFLAGQFTGLLRFFRIPDALRLFAASSCATGVFLIFWVFTSYQYVPPGSVLLMDYVIFTFAIIGLRVGIRIVDERRKGFFRQGAKPDRVAIVGAGQAASALSSELSSRPELAMRPVAFFDDDAAKHGRQLHGLPIVGAPESIPSFHATHDLDRVVLAMPSASRERVGQIVSLLKRQRIPVDTVPSVEQVMRGELRDVLIRELRIEDLLYREPVKLDTARMGEHVRERAVLVTGAGGSIGSELARQLAVLQPRELILVDRNEASLFITQQQVRDDGETEPVVCVIDIRDHAEMDRFFKRHQPEMIFHAAAHKHVGMMEHQPAEAFFNNTIATLNLARQATQHKVKTFCLISTDKAVEPSSVMGATKRLAEKAIQSLIDVCESGPTAFSMVRFGNVIGSSGSVIPIFEKQIAARKAVTVTDREMTRYFMTIPEAAGLVLQASTYGNGGCLFTLDMGKPVRIDDVARDLIRLRGLEPDVDIPVVYSGRRAGEKLHEALHYSEEVLEPTDHDKIRRIKVQAQGPEAAKAFLRHLEETAQEIAQVDPLQAKELVFALLES